MTALTRAAALALALTTLAPLTACSQTEEEGAPQRDKNVERTLAVAITGAPELSTVSAALTDAGLAGVFDGPGSYTILAPNDAAFAKLGGSAGQLTAEDNRALLVAVLRDHILPGHVTPDTIRESIKQNGGPVGMRTLGEGAVTFSLDGDTIAIEGVGGRTARTRGEAHVASNGVVIPIDGLLKAPQPAAAAQ